MAPTSSMYALMESCIVLRCLGASTSRRISIRKIFWRLVDKAIA